MIESLRYCWWVPTLIIYCTVSPGSVNGGYQLINIQQESNWYPIKLLTLSGGPGNDNKNVQMTNWYKWCTSKVNTY